MKTDKIRLAIADDSIRLQKALQLIFQNEDDIELVLIANNGVDLLAKLKVVTTMPDIILMDIQMPEMNGIEATERIRNQYPSIKIIALSQFDNESNIIQMYKRGVKSFIGKGNDIEELLTAIRVVNCGGGYMTGLALSIIQKQLPSPNDPLAISNEMPDLTDFEKKLLSAIYDGQSSTKIGFFFFKSPRTIEKHREKLYKKFNVSSKEELIKATYQYNLHNSNLPKV